MRTGSVAIGGVHGGGLAHAERVEGLDIGKLGEFIDVVYVGFLYAFQLPLSWLYKRLRHALGVAPRILVKVRSDAWKPGSAWR